MLALNESLLTAVVTATATTFSMVALLPWLRTRVVDHPNWRSSHATPTPRGAGIAVLIGFAAGCLAAEFWQSGGAAAVFTAGVLLGILGFADDLSELDVGFRFGCQAVVCAVALVVVMRPDDAPHIALMACACVVAVGYTNAFNFMDGINGMSALSAAVAALWFVSRSSAAGHPTVAYLCLALAAAALAFLPWNVPRAAAFLGDVGSYAMGSTLALVGVFLWHEGVPLGAVAAPLVVYVSDTGVALIRRIIARRSWHEAHREHVYQRLVDGGRSHTTVAATVACISAAECGIWLGVHRWGVIPTTTSMAVPVAVYLLLPRLVARETGLAL